MKPTNFWTIEKANNEIVGLKLKLCLTLPNKTLQSHLQPLDLTGISKTFWEIFNR